MDFFSIYLQHWNTYRRVYMCTYICIFWWNIYYKSVLTMSWWSQVKEKLNPLWCFSDGFNCIDFLDLLQQVFSPSMSSTAAPPENFSPPNVDSCATLPPGTANQIRANEQWKPGQWTVKYMKMLILVLPPFPPHSACSCPDGVKPVCTAVKSPLHWGNKNAHHEASPERLQPHVRKEMLLTFEKTYYTISL